MICYMVIVTGILVLLVRATQATTGNQRDFVAANPQQFGLKADSSNFAPINALQEDKEQPGTFLALQGYALVRFQDGLKPHILAGLPQTSGAIDSNSSEARFGSMYGFIQIENTSKILIADVDNACIREVERTIWTVSTYSGLCSNSSKGSKTIINGNIKDARYIYPFDIASPPGLAAVQYITDKNYVRVIFVEDDTIYTLTKATKWWSSGFFKRISFSPSNNLFITTHEDGIYVFEPTDTKLQFRTKLVPDYSTQNAVTAEFFNRTANGVNSFFSLEALTNRFERFEDVIPLTDDVILATLGGQLMTQSLVFIDVKQNSMTLVCVSMLVGERSLPAGLSGVCEYQTTGRDIQIINSTLYISGSPSTEDIYSSGVERVAINDYCTLGGHPQKYPIDTNITHNNQDTTCFLDPYTLTVGWTREGLPVQNTIHPPNQRSNTATALAITVPTAIMVLLFITVLVVKLKFPHLINCSKNKSKKATDNYLAPQPRGLPVPPGTSTTVAEHIEYETIGGDYQNYHLYESADLPTQLKPRATSTTQQLSAEGGVQDRTQSPEIDNYVINPTTVYMSNISHLSS